MTEPSRSAFIVANDEYADERLRRLRAPAADARELAGVLGDPDVGGFDVALSVNEPEHVLRVRLAEFFERRGLDDVLLLHLSCHGVKDEDGRLYFATPDTQVDHLEATALPAEFVNRQMTRSRSRRVVLLLDCCYSGAFARGWMSRAGDAVDLRDRFDGRGRIVLTASSAMEYSFEGDQLSGEGSPSVFTSALVQGLTTGEADRNRDGYISVDELYDYAFDQVRAATPSQTPGKWVFDVQGDFFVARSRRERPAEPEGLPADLLAATMSPFAHVRLGAVEELRGLLAHPDERVSTPAREQLTAMLADDSQRVSRAAADALGATPEPAGTAAPAEPEPQPTIRQPDARPSRAAPERQPPGWVAWAGRLGALGMLAMVPYSLATTDPRATWWNSFAVLSPVEGLLAAVAAWLVVDALRSGRTSTSVGAGALLATGVAVGASALGLASFSSAYAPAGTGWALVVALGAALTAVAGLGCLVVARPSAHPAMPESGPLLVAGTGVVAAFAALFIPYDGQSSLSSEVGETTQLFTGAAGACLVALAALLVLPLWPRPAVGALLATGGIVAVHYLGVVLASANAIGEPGDTRAGGFVGILGGLLVAVGGAYAHAPSAHERRTR